MRISKERLEKAIELVKETDRRPYTQYDDGFGSGVEELYEILFGKEELDFALGRNSE